MDKEILKSIVLEQNKRKHKKTVYRDVNEKIDKLIKTPFVIILTGIRRSGKSTILDQLRKKYNAYYNYLNFDDYRLINFKLDDFYKLEKVFLELYGNKNIYFFDEIQNIKGWERFVRTLHDRGKKIIITGSNATLLSSELGTHLTGRNIPIMIFPFSFKEFLRFKGFEFEKNDLYLTDVSVSILKLFKEYLKFGGMPEYLKTKEIDYLKNVYDNIIFKDIVGRYKITNTRSLKDLLYFLMSNIGKEISYNTLKNIISVKNATTVKEYISYFENSYLIFTINKFDYSLKKQLLNPKKIYSIDTGLTNSISFKFSEDKGRLLENLVFIELKRRGKEVYYHKHKKECDFVIKQGLEITDAIQVTTSLEDPETKKREIQGLIDALKTYNLKEGLILTEDEEGEFVEDDKKTGMEFKIRVMPVWKFLLENQTF